MAALSKKSGKCLFSGISLCPQARAIQLGAVGAAVEALARFEGAGQLQEQACRALATLCHESAEGKAKAVRADAVEVLIKALLDNPKSAGLQEQACHALSSVVAGSKDSQLRAAVGGGIEAVAAALRHHREEAGVQTQARNAWHKAIFRAQPARNRDPQRLRGGVMRRSRSGCPPDCSAIGRNPSHKER